MNSTAIENKSTTISGTIVWNSFLKAKTKNLNSKLIKNFTIKF